MPWNKIIMTTIKQFSASTLLLASFAIVALLVAPAISFASAPDKTDGFVCPVFNSNSAVGEHNPNAFPIADGDYSLIPSGSPHTISIPIHATNGDGAGSPGGAHSSPGDSDYTAIWNNS